MAWAGISDSAALLTRSREEQDVDPTDRTEDASTDRSFVFGGVISSRSGRSSNTATSLSCRATKKAKVAGQLVFM